MICMIKKASIHKHVLKSLRVNSGQDEIVSSFTKTSSPPLRWEEVPQDVIFIICH